MRKIKALGSGKLEERYTVKWSSIKNIEQQDKMKRK